MLEQAGLFLLMSFKGQEEDNRHQLSKITKGEIFTEIYHCLLLGGLAFLVCVPPPQLRSLWQHEHPLKVPSVVGRESALAPWRAVAA